MLKVTESWDTEGSMGRLYIYLVIYRKKQTFM